MKADHPSQVQFAASLPPTCPCSGQEVEQAGVTQGSPQREDGMEGPMLAGGS